MEAELTDKEAFRFSQQATFGANAEDLAELKELNLSAWIQDQLEEPHVPYTPRIEDLRNAEVRIREDILQTLFWERAIHGEDQLRQRMTYALSQIVVASLRDPQIAEHISEFGIYADLLQDHALGNYCSLIRDISFNPVMGMYLTHLGNRKEDVQNGFVPDENYAREILQLFTIGLEELDESGRGLGHATYSQDDIEGLAEVFTGLSWADTDFDRPRVTDNNRYLPMESFRAQHEDRAKTFMQTTVNVGNDAVDSINAALDYLLEHPNVAPFISKQLIQKLVTSNPSPDYVRRVAEAFSAGQYELPNGDFVGTGQRCDLAATAAAILTDPEARGETTDENFGKIRSPLLRVAHFIRAYRNEKDVTTSGVLPSGRSLDNLDSERLLEQNAFAAPSVFNDFRPGYVAPGTESAELGLKTPELQIASAPAMVAYINVMRSFIEIFEIEDGEDLVADFDVSYNYELAAEDIPGLVDQVIADLMGGQFSEENRARIIEAVEAVPVTQKQPEKTNARRWTLAALMTVTSPEYMVQQ
ncbi:MAG: DUF1800 domain-containing protein [Parvularculaceae bacterium]|nr:DUF1800 domain-containing protein [Parvularculaceae bacterium]